MHNLKIIITFAVLFFSGNLFSQETPKYIIQREYRSTLSPTGALEKLKAGNLRYLLQKVRRHDYLVQSLFLARHGQFPFAFILNCMDSRSVPSLLFDQGVGSIFTSSVAGNVVDIDMLASMEYAVYTGVKLIVVMGHTQCGAIEAACLNIGFGNITTFLKKIKPAVEREQKIMGKLNCNHQETLTRIALNNVYNMVNIIRRQSPYLEEKLLRKEIMIVGALHHIKTGKVDFYPIVLNIKKTTNIIR